MGIGKFFEKLGSKINDGDEDSPTGDKHLDYLERENQLRKNELRKKYLKAKLQKVQKGKFKEFVKPTMIKGKYKNKYKKYKVKL